MTPVPRAVVIGVGNPYRRDDGVGPAVAAAIGARDLPGVRVVVCDGEPAGLLDAWAGADLAIIVDAVRSVPPATPGLIHRCPAGQLGQASQASSHGLSLADALRLGHALGRYPRRVVILAVEAADLRPGTGLSEAAAAAVPGVVTAVTAELRRPEVPAARPLSVRHHRDRAAGVVQDGMDD